MRIALFVASCLLATACKKSEDTPRSTPEPLRDSQRVAAAPEAAVPPAAMPSSDALRVLAAAGNRTGIELWKRASGNGNAAMSPASISTALAMTLNGARGKTADEMRAVMHLDGDPAAAIRTWGQLASALQDPKRGAVVRNANRLFGQDGFKIEPDFLDSTRASFGAPLERLDFVRDPEAARARINGWVEDQTERRIREVLGPRTITSEVRLVLVNAIYFKATWLHPFQRMGTHPAPFWTSARASVDVPTMHAREQLRIAEGVAGGAKVRVLELPYKGNDTAMLVILPENRTGLAQVERAFDDAVLARWTGALAAHDVEVALPKFTIDPPQSIELGGPLQALGMVLAFDPDAADLSGVAKPTADGKRLFVQKVIHKAFVKVDELGTEAAAATAVIDASGMGGMPPRDEVFTADHPFLFAIVDTSSQLVLFMGRVTDPHP